MGWWGVFADKNKTLHLFIECASLRILLQSMDLLVLKQLHVRALNKKEAFIRCQKEKAQRMNLEEHWRTTRHSHNWKECVRNEGRV